MCFGQTTLKFRVIYTLSSNKNHLNTAKSAPQNSTEKPARTVQKKNCTGGLLSIPKSSAYSRYAYRHEAEQPPPAAGYREQTIIRSTRSRQRNLKLSGRET